jgi:toluene monooxygenase system protein D
MDNPVGPILRMSDEVEPVIEAIRDDNPDREIEVIDRGAYVRVQADGYLVVTEESLQRQLGSNFRIRSLEVMLTAFAGRIQTFSDRIEWHLAASPNGPAGQG